MKYVILFLLTSFFLACQDIDTCDANTDRSYMIVRFYDTQTQQSKKVEYRFFIEDEDILRQYLFSADTTISQDGDTTIVSDSTYVLLPLNPLDTAITILFNSDTMDHFMQVSYEVQYTIFDPTCDPSLTFIGLDTLSSTFDSTAVVGRTTNVQLTTNIEIYL